MKVSYILSFALFTRVLEVQTLLVIQSKYGHIGFGPINGRLFPIACNANNRTRPVLRHSAHFLTLTQPQAHPTLESWSPFWVTSRFHVWEIFSAFYILPHSQILHVEEISAELIIPSFTIQLTVKYIEHFKPKFELCWELTWKLPIREIHLCKFLIHLNEVFDSPFCSKWKMEGNFPTWVNIWLQIKLTH